MLTLQLAESRLGCGALSRLLLRLSRRPRRQRKRDHDIARGNRRFPQVTRTARNNYYILLAVAAAIGDGGGVTDRIEFRQPQFLAGARLERSEFGVGGGRDEQNSAACRDAAAQVNRSEILKPFGLHLVIRSQRNPPDHVTGVSVDGRKFSPWRLIARVTLLVHKTGVRSLIAEGHRRTSGAGCHLSGLA